MGRYRDRKQFFGRVGALCTALAALAVALAPATAPAAAPPEQAGDSARTVAQVSRYWTSERMDDAKPLKLVSAEIDAAAPPAPGKAAGEPVTQAGNSVAFSSYELSDTRSFPNRVHGKVFFTRPGVGNFVCSGTVVTAGNRSTVITAGHCVHDGGSWSTNFAFAPGYYRTSNGSGAAPYGIWAASDESAPQPWVDSGNLRFDVGAAVIATNAAGQTLENVVGGRGIAFNQPASQYYRSYGYPAQPTSSRPFDGTRLWACDSNPPGEDSPNAGPGPNTMGIGCDMTGGSSGGGWVVNASSSGGYLNGVNSYKYSNEPNLIYGPYFGSSIKALYDFSAGLPPGTPGSSGVGNSVPAGLDSVPAPRQVCKKVRRLRKSAKRKRLRRARKAAKRTCRSRR